MYVCMNIACIQGLISSTVILAARIWRDAERAHDTIHVRRLGMRADCFQGMREHSSTHALKCNAGF
jgi:hypothetical protein